MAGVISDSHALASLCVCVCVCVCVRVCVRACVRGGGRLSFLPCSLIFPHMKSAHFLWSLLFLCSPVLQPDPARDHRNDVFPLVLL